MGQMARQQEDATRKGINALEQAFSGVQRSRQEVETTKADTGLGGATGAKYVDLLNSWDERAEQISKNLQQMIDKLNETLQQSGLTIGSTSDEVNQEFQRSQSIFDALNG